MATKTALQQFIEWGDNMMLEHPLKLLSFAEAIDKAAELLIVERDQIELAFDEGSEYEYQYHINGDYRKEASTYYNETYGK
jgi:hypothetical protein